MNNASPTSRPGTASLPVRPVTARTWQALNAGEAAPKRGAAGSKPCCTQYCASPRCNRSAPPL